MNLKVPNTVPGIKKKKKSVTLLGNNPEINIVSANVQFY